MILLNPNWVFKIGLTFWRIFWAKWPKTALKLQNQHFGRTTLGGMEGWGQANFLGSRGSPLVYLTYEKRYPSILPYIIIATFSKLSLM